MRTRRLVVSVVLAGLLLGGCGEGTRAGIAVAVGSAVDQGRSAALDDGEAAEPAPEPEPESELTSEEPAPETEAPVEEEAEPAGIPWGLFLLGLLLAFVVWGLRVLGRRRADVRARRDRLRDVAIAEGEWLLGAARERAAGVDASARARDVRMRLDRLTDALQRLRTGANDKVVTAADDLQTAARQLADALVVRLDDAVAGRDTSTDLGVEELAQRLRVALDTFGTTLGRKR